MDYAIIKVGGKQHRVRDGETLIVDRVPVDEGNSFEPVVLLGEDKVTVKVLGHGRGPKIRIGKYRRRTGYKRHTGFRAATTQIEITLGAGTKRTAAKPAAAKTETPKAEAPKVEAPKSEASKTEAPTSEAVAAAPAAPAGLPEGYADLKVGEVSAQAKDWSHEQLEAALAYEQANAARKGAITALEAGLAKEGEA
jgi:large subunit ribosomal protein L21